MMLEGQHRTEEGYNRIKGLAKEVNNNPFNGDPEGQEKD